MMYLIPHIHVFSYVVCIVYVVSMSFHVVQLPQESRLTCDVHDGEDPGDDSLDILEEFSLRAMGNHGKNS